MDAFQRRTLPRVLGPTLLSRFEISRSRVRTELRHGTWRALAAGIVLTRPDDPTREDWADVGVLLAGADAALSGWDALRACGLSAGPPPPHPVLVLSPSAMTRTVGGARIRRTDRPFTSRTQPLGAPYELLPIASVARAVADHALQSRDLGALRTLVGSAVGRRQCGVPDLLAEYEGGPRKHSKLLRGRLLYVVDLLWRELRAALEIDSREYHFGIEDWEATLDRHNERTRYGLAVMHYAPRRVTCRGSTFVPDVADWLRRRALELHIPLPAGHGVRRPPADEATPPFVINTGNP